MDGVTTPIIIERNLARRTTVARVDSARLGKANDNGVTARVVIIDECADVPQEVWDRVANVLRRRKSEAK